MRSDWPAHLALVNAAVSDGLPDRAAVAGPELQGIRIALQDATRGVCAALLGKGEVTLDRYSLPTALECPASSERSPFAWTPRFAARTLGIRATERAVCCRQGAAEAVSAVIDEVVAEGRGLGEWLNGQDVPLRAATSAAAATWAARALVAIPWAALGTVRFDVRTWHRPHGHRSPVVLAGRSDVVVLHRGPWAIERILVGIAPANPVVARLDVLVTTLETGRAPVRHIAVDTASGQVTAVDVDRAMLDRAISEVAAAAVALAPIAGGDVGVTVPGPQCWRCDRREGCEDGIRWLGAEVPRVGGIPC